MMGQMMMIMPIFFGYITLGLPAGLTLQCLASTLQKSGTNLALGTSAADKKIVLIAGKQSHGPGDHEHRAGCLLLQKCLGAVPGLTTLVYSNGWPQDASVFDGADAVILGHCHLPVLKTLAVGGRQRHFSLLGDWLGHRSYIVLDGGRFELRFWEGEGNR